MPHRPYQGEPQAPQDVWCVDSPTPAALDMPPHHLPSLLYCTLAQLQIHPLLPVLCATLPRPLGRTVSPETLAAVAARAIAVKQEPGGYNLIPHGSPVRHPRVSL